MTVAAFFLGARSSSSPIPFERLPVPARRGRGPEPAAPELLDDDPPAVALHGLRERVGAVRVRDRGARDRAARRPVDPHDAALDALRLVLPLARQPPRRAAGPTRCSAGAATGPGTRSRTRPSCPGSSATAYLHSVMIQEKKDMLKVWNMVLVLLTFALTIFGTFLTRSGVISSVHSFTQSGLGPVLHRLPAVRDPRRRRRAARLPPARAAQRRTPSSRSSRARRRSCSTTWCWSASPSRSSGARSSRCISEWVRGVKITVGPPFFNRVNAPLGIALLFLTGVGPLIAWRRAIAAQPARALRGGRCGAGARGRRRAARRAACRSAARCVTFVARRLRARHDRAGVLARHARAPGDARTRRAPRALGAPGRQEPAALRRLHHPRRHRLHLRRHRRRRARSASRCSETLQAGRDDAGRARYTLRYERIDDARRTATSRA